MRWRWYDRLFCDIVFGRDRLLQLTATQLEYTTISRFESIYAVAFFLSDLRITNMVTQEVSNNVDTTCVAVSMFIFLFYVICSI